MRPWHGWVLLGLVVLLEGGRRAWLGHVPHDFSAYLAAAETLARGKDPYGADLFASPWYGGYPYVYPPFTQALLGPLGWLGPWAGALVELAARVGALVGVLVLGERLVHGTLLQRPGGAPEEAWPLGRWVLLALGMEPVLADWLAGNLELYMLLALLALVWATQRDGAMGRSGAVGPRRWAPLGTALLAGVALSVKPAWWLAVVPLLLVFPARAPVWWALAAGGACAALTLGSGERLHSWLGRVDAIRAYYPSFNLLELVPLAAYGALLMAWGAALWWLSRRRPEAPVWLLGLASVWIWPRMDSYTYLAMLPVAMYLRHVRGTTAMLLWSLVALGPLPWALRFGQGAMVLKGTLFLWSLGTFVWLYRGFWAEGLARPEDHGAPGAWEA